MTIEELENENRELQEMLENADRWMSEMLEFMKSRPMPKSERPRKTTPIPKQAGSSSVEYVRDPPAQ